MTWLLYDDVTTGHHLPFLRLVDAELRQRGVMPLVASGAPLGEVSDTPRRWIELETVPHRAISANRRQLGRLASAAAALGVDTFLDLFFDKNAWAVDRVRPFRRRVHILHHIDQMAPGARSGLAAIRAGVLRRLVNRSRVIDDSVVVHTPQAAEIMADVLDVSRVFEAPFPVELSAPQRQPPEGGPPVLAFIGGARHEKGLDLLAAATRKLGRRVEIRVFGPQSAETIDTLTPRFGSEQVRWIEAELDVPELRAQISTCSLAVLPYRKKFGQYGGSSASLMDAMAVGLPVVVSPALEPQLAPDYGAVVSRGDEAHALAEAIDAALSELEHLDRQAAKTGPAYLAEHHSPARYVDVLERAADASER